MAPPPKFTPPADAVPVKESAQPFVPPADAVPVKKKDASTSSSTPPAAASVPSSALGTQTGASPSVSTPGSLPMTSSQAMAARMRNNLAGTLSAYQLQSYNPLSSTAGEDPQMAAYKQRLAAHKKDFMGLEAGEISRVNEMEQGNINQVNSYNQSIVDDNNSKTIAENTPGTPEYYAKNNPGVAMPVAPEDPLVKSRRYYRNYLQQYDPQKLTEYDATVAGQSGPASTELLAVAHPLTGTQMADVAIEGMAQAQKTKAQFDQEAMMFTVNGASKNLNILNSALANQYKPQLDMADKISNWPKDDQGQPIFTDPKSAQDYQTMVGELNASPDFISLYKNAAQQQQTMGEMAQAGKTFLDQYPQYKEQFNLASEAERHGVEDLGIVHGGIINPAIRTVASAAQSLSYLPKAEEGIMQDITGQPSYNYDWADRLYDAASEVYGTQAAINFPMSGSLQEGIDPLTGQKTRTYSEGFIPALTQSITQMGLILAGGEAAAGLTSGTSTAATIGQVGSAAALSMNQFYEAGKAGGMTDKEAMNYALVSGITSGLFMAANPIGKTVASGALGDIAKNSVSEYASALVRGEGTSVARAAAMKSIANDIVGVNMVGVGQKLSEYATNYIANTATGANMDTGQNIGKDMWDIATMSTVMGGMFGAMQHGGEAIYPEAKGSAIFKEALYNAALDPTRYKEALGKMKDNGVATDDRVVQLSANIDRAAAALASMPDNLTHAKKMDLLPDMVIKQQLKEQLKTTDEALKPIVEEKIAAADEALQKKAGIETSAAEGELSDDEMAQVDHLQFLKKEGLADDADIQKLDELSARMPEEEKAVEQPAAEEQVAKRDEIRNALVQMRDEGTLVNPEGTGKMSDQEIDTHMALMDAMADTWKNTTGKDDFYDSFVSDVKSGSKKGVKGAITFAEDGRAAIKFFDGADVSTLTHEMGGHIGRRVLEKLSEGDEGFAKDYQTAQDWAGVKNGTWDRKAEEKFARGFERYLTEGKAPNSSLEKVFGALKDWLTNIYKTIKGSSIDVNITDEMRKVFDNLLSEKETAKTEAEKTEVAPKTQEDATQKGIIEKGDQLQHPNGDESRTPTETGGSNRNVKSGQEQEEVTSLRHGETSEDVQNKNSGHSDAPLTEEGKKEAEQKGEQLKEKGIKHIIASPIERAKETAEIAGKVAGADVITDESLKTWDIGEFGNKDVKDFDEKYYVEHPDEKVPGGESFNSFKDRMKQSYDMMKKAPEDTDFISHSRNNRAYDALEKNGGEWTDKTSKDYLASTQEENVDVQREPAPVSTTDTPEAVKKVQDRIDLMNMTGERAMGNAPMRTLFKRTIADINNAVRKGEMTAKTGNELAQKAERAWDKKINAPIDEGSSRIIMALRKMELFQKEEGKLGAEDLVKFGADVYKRMLKKGESVDNAVNKAVEAMKSNRLWEKFGSPEMESRARREFTESMKQEKTAQATESPASLTEEGRTRASAGLRRMVNSPRLSPEVKQGLLDRGIEYVQTSEIKTETEAQEMVKFAESQGQMDQLYNDLISKDVKFKNPLTRGMTALALFEHYQMNPAEGTADRMARLADEASRIATFSGATSSIIGKFNERVASGTEEGMVSYAEAQAKREAEKIYNGQKKSNDKLIGKINEEAAKVKPKEVSPEKKAAIAKKREWLLKELGSLFQKVEKKIPTTEAIRKTAEVLKTYLEEGETANAVSKFRRDCERVSGKKPPEEMIERALDEVVEGKPLRDIITGERKIKQLISDRFSSMSDKAKVKLTAEVSQHIGESGKITDEQFKEAYTEAMKGDILSDEVIEKMKSDRKLTIAAKGMENDVKKVFDDWKDARDKAHAEGRMMTKAEEKAFKKDAITKWLTYKKAMEKAAEARMRTAKAFIQPDIWNKLSGGERGNLMTVVTGLSNIVANVAVTPIRASIRGLANIAEYLSVKSANKILGTKMDRSMNPIAEAYGMSKFGTRFSFYKTFRRLITGSAIEGEKMDLRPPGLNMVDDWKNLFKGKKPGETRFIERKLSEAYGATFGAPADVMSRLAAVPDYFGRTMGEIGRAYEIAKTKTVDGKPLSEQEVWEKTMFPDEKDAAAISKAGKKAVYMQENELSKSIQTIGAASLAKLAEMGPFGRHMAGFIKLLKAGIFPFTTVPVNLVGEMLSFTVPEVGMIGGARDMYFSKKAEQAGDHEKALDYRRSGLINFSKSAFAMGASSVIGNLCRYGLVQPNSSRDEKPGEKAADYAYTHPGSFNWTAMQRMMSGDAKWYEIKDDDTWCSYQKLGTVGMMLGVWSEIYRHDSQNEIEETNPVYDAFFNTIGAGLKSSFDQSFLKSESDFLTILSNPDSKGTAYWTANYGVTMAHIFLPNEVAQISKGSDDLLRDTRGNTVGEMFLNNMKNSLFMGDQLPSKVTLWGDDIKSAPNGTNPYYYYLMSVMKSSEYEGPQMGRKLFDFYRTTDDDEIRGKIWPKTPSQQITVSGKTVNLTGDQYHEYQVLVGKQRAMETQKYVMYGSFDTDSPEVRAKRLNSIYAAGQERGKQMLIMNDPKLLSARAGVDLSGSDINMPDVNIPDINIPDIQ